MLDVGQVVDDKYRIVRHLGRGGMGAVFEALHVKIKRRVAIKVIVDERMRKNADAMARFRREASAAGRIETQHIVQVLDTGDDPVSGFPYIAMELLQGEDLERLSARLGPLAPDLVLRILAQALLGLSKAHAAGVIHRDIKPGNLFVATRDAGEVVVKLLDFGIAKTECDAKTDASASVITQTGIVMGSLDYLSPEQATGARDMDHRTDLYSLGVVAYRALSTRGPHDHHDSLGRRLIALCQEHARHLQDAAPWVRPAMAGQVHKALQVESSRRFQSANEWFEIVSLMLPDGWTIHQKMLTSLSDQQRSQLAPRLPITPTGALMGSMESICREDFEEAASHAAPTERNAQQTAALRGSAQVTKVAARGVAQVAAAKGGWGKARGVPAATAIDAANAPALGVFGRLEAVYIAAARWDALCELYESRIKTRATAGEKTELLRSLARMFNVKLRNKERAFGTLMRAFQIDFGDAVTVEQLERLAEETNRWGELVASCDQWLSSESKPERALQLNTQLARWYADHGHSDSARPYLQRAVELAGNEPGPLRTLASIYRKMGQPEDACRLLDRALRQVSFTEERLALSSDLGAVSRDPDEPSPIGLEKAGGLRA
jgi:serine/threonine protein kinase